MALIDPGSGTMAQKVPEVASKAVCALFGAAEEDWGEGRGWGCGEERSVEAFRLRETV